MAHDEQGSPQRIVRPIPQLMDLQEIPVPSYYRGHNQRIQDYLDGFRTAWELALSIQDDVPPPLPVWA